MSNRRIVSVLLTLAALVLSLSLTAACSSSDGDVADGDGQQAAAASDSSGEGGTEAAIDTGAGYKLTQTFETSTIEITSDVFSRIRRLKIDYTCHKQRNLNQQGEWEVGLDKSPPMKFEGVPEGTVSLALIMDDPDVIEPEAEILQAKVHWVLWNLPPDTTELPVQLATTTELAMLGPNVRQGTNGYGIPATPGHARLCPPSPYPKAAARTTRCPTFTRAFRCCPTATRSRSTPSARSSTCRPARRRTSYSRLWTAT